MAMYGGDVSPKLIVLGEANVGKTSILEQWLHGTFTHETAPTIGAGLSTVPLMVDGTAHTFNIWDTAGTPQFRSVVPMYCRQAAIAIIVFDLTVSTTFEQVRTWYDFVRETADPVFLLVGNKLDLVDSRTVDHDRALDCALHLAAQLECEYVEMSARTREGIDEFSRAVIKSARKSLERTCVRAPQPAEPAPAPEKSECGC
jgi:Ras-related protein Rab-5C